MSAITTHVLDILLGKPAQGVPVLLERQAAGGAWHTIGRGKTDAQGRVRGLSAPGSKLEAATYRLTFDTAAYFHERNIESFYPRVEVVFVVHDPAQHYHVPLLLSPFGYSTYRGS